MKLIFAFNALTLLIGSVHAGSRAWEVDLATSSSAASSINKRAISILPGNGNGASRRWPDKTLTYAYADKDAQKKLAGIFSAAIEIWGELRDNINGFKYKLISIKDCEKKRSECLVIHYNDKGQLSSTVGIQPVDKSVGYLGPVMHLSDKEHVGNLDANVNAAHELGHAWGLWHEHQNPNFWYTSNFGEVGWIMQLQGKYFPTENYKCENFKDYEQALEKLKQHNAGLQDHDQIPVELLCRSPGTSRMFGFSAAEWVPQANSGRLPDREFDPDSIMLYPSGAGGKGDARPGSDNRLPILTYSDGTPIPLRKGPSPRDFEKLIELYGRDLSREPVQLLNDRASTQSGYFKKLRLGGILRGGSTKSGIC
ncbi:hypothetical protein FGRMN_4130 [Fusarium graminum]|nr:hypothetical protein FGRMN_4130 [Fusarium graminum]